LGSPATPAQPVPLAARKVPPPQPTQLEWPAGRLEGEPAKRLLLDVMLAAKRRLEAVPGYTAIFRKQERLNGTLREEQTLRMKVRHEPFAVYLKFLAPKAGKEVLYAEGQHDNKLIAHNGDWTRRLIPRLKVSPTDPLALADSRHPITEAGLLKLVNKLIHFRQIDLEDPEAVTILDRTTDEHGRAWLRSTHYHPHYSPERPYQKTFILYDPETWLPLRITNYEWAHPGEDSDEEPVLVERYAYDDLRLDAPLTSLDFDLSNPEYEFSRY
ncbi:MAG: DUF1571 domain-containing protein, partial [Isosphaeraceae bacterium]|nr:DUF1571 domain-containing protein [Isosphaeraceae bacterium]